MFWVLTQCFGSVLTHILGFLPDISGQFLPDFFGCFLPKFLGSYPAFQVNSNLHGQQPSGHAGIFFLAHPAPWESPRPVIY